MKTLILTVIFVHHHPAPPAAAKIEYTVKDTTMTCIQAVSEITKQYQVPKGYTLDVKCAEKM